MKRAELLLVDAAEVAKSALVKMVCPFDFAIRQGFPRENAEGTLVTYQEYDNRSTDCPVVDYVEVQVDLWAYDRETVRLLAAEVNRVLIELGLKRTYMGPEVMENGIYERKTMRFGRNVDKRWMRFVD